MQHDLRRKDRQLSDAESRSILAEGEYGILSMSTGEAEGYGVPLNYVFHTGSVYLHCAKEGQKLDIIRKNSGVSFCVVGRTELLPSRFSTKYESVIVFGKAVEIEGDEKREALMELLKKYFPENIENGIAYIDRSFEKVTIIKIPAETITGKARKNY